MPGLLSNYKELKTFFNHHLVLVLGLLVVTGCATTGDENAFFDNDAERNIASKIQQKAQDSWESANFEASADYHFTLAQAYSAEGNLDRAIEEYRAALVYDPQSSMLHSRLSGEYLKKGMTSFAIEEAQLALKFDPQSVEVHIMLGGIYSITEQLDLALSHYDSALKLDPTSEEAAVFKAQTLVEKDEISTAASVLKKFTAQVKDSAASWYYLGKLEHSREHFTQALKYYRKSLEIRPGFPQATVAAGFILEQHQEFDKAIELYEQQLELQYDPIAAGRLVTLHLKENRLNLALKTLKVMAAVDPEELNVQLKIGLIHMQQTEWDAAKATFAQILKKVPDSDKVNYYMAAVYEEKGQFDKAIQHLGRVTPDSSLFEDAHLHAAALYRKQDQKAKAKAVLEHAVEQSPENVGFYLVLASYFEEENDLKTASGQLKKGLEVFPTHEKMRYFYGVMLDRLGRPDDAVAEMEKVLEQNPNHADALNFVAYTWTAQGTRLGEAQELLERALELKPDSPYILDSLGWNQFLLGNAKKALVYLEKAVSLKSDEPTILEHLVEAYAKNQMPERAQATLGKLKAVQSSGSRGPASVAP